ncbi:MAG: putative Ig domain-containing protein, partial [Pseudomonadota bacterium]
LTTTSTLPAGLSLAANGTLSGTLGNEASAASPYTIEITATDAQGATVTDSFVFTITNPAPTVVTPLADQNADDADTLSIATAASFADGAPDGDDLSFAATGLPTGFAIDATTGLITGTLAANASATSPYTITVTATDAQGASVATAFNLFVENLNPNIAADLQDVAATDAVAITAIDIAAGFTDPDGDGLDFTVTGLPAGLSYDAATDTIIGTPDRDASQGGPASDGAYTVTVTATDDAGAEAVQSFILTVSNPAPTTSGITDKAAVDGAVVSIPTASAFADADNDGLTFAVTGLPTGLSFDAATGLITGTLPAEASVNGPYAITVTATDGDGDSVSTSFNLTVTNPAPTALGLTDQASTDGAAISLDLAPRFNDADGDALSLTTTSTLPAGLSLAANGTLSGTLGN